MKLCFCAGLFTDVKVITASFDDVSFSFASSARLLLSPDFTANKFVSADISRPADDSVSTLYVSSTSPLFVIFSVCRVLSFTATNSALFPDIVKSALLGLNVIMKLCFCAGLFTDVKVITASFDDVSFSFASSARLLLSPDFTANKFVSANISRPTDDSVSTLYVSSTSPLFVMLSVCRVLSFTATNSVLFPDIVKSALLGLNVMVKFCFCAGLFTDVKVITASFDDVSFSFASSTRLLLSPDFTANKFVSADISRPADDSVSTLYVSSTSPLFVIFSVCRVLSFTATNSALFPDIVKSALLGLNVIMKLCFCAGLFTDVKVITASFDDVSFSFASSARLLLSPDFTANKFVSANISRPADDSVSTLYVSSTSPLFVIFSVCRVLSFTATNNALFPDIAKSALLGLNVMVKLQFSFESFSETAVISTLPILDSDSITL